MVEWNISPELFSIGPFSIRWYGLLFAGSFLVGFQIMRGIYKTAGKKEDDLNDLIWYMIVGTVVGARLGHCIFYNPAYYFTNPMKILMIWEGGLASHGAAIGILIAIYAFVHNKKGYTFLWTMDRVVITVALAGFFIRTGNLFNSEIIGKPTDLPWSFVFQRIDNIPRHPAQLYEALVYLCIFIFLFITYKKYKEKLNAGYLFGWFLTLIFLARFLIEFVKENQSRFEAGMALNMGQILSTPLILLGLFLLYRIKFKPVD